MYVRLVACRPVLYALDAVNVLDTLSSRYCHRISVLSVARLLLLMLLLLLQLHRFKDTRA